MSSSDQPPLSADIESPPQLGLEDKQYREALGELLDRIETLPPDHRHMLSSLVDQTRQRHEKLRHSVARLQETLDTLRVSMKYLIFDVEATRRENEYLRRKLAEYLEE